MIKIIDGSLFHSDADMIIHQTNCQGVMGSGVARQVKDLYPEVFASYRGDYEKGLLKLGYVSFGEAFHGQVFANMCGQDNYGYDGNQYTNYDALQECLNRVSEYAKANNLKSIALPYMMSCFRGGGDWNVVLKMIEDTFKDFEVEIWKL